MERYIYLADHLEHLASQAAFLALLCVDLVTTHYDKLRCTSSSRVPVLFTSLLISQ